MAKPIRALELYYPMVQFFNEVFLISLYTFFFNRRRWNWLFWGLFDRGRKATKINNNNNNNNDCVSNLLFLFVAVTSEVSFGVSPWATGFAPEAAYCSRSTGKDQVCQPPLSVRTLAFCFFVRLMSYCVILKVAVNTLKDLYGNSAKRLKKINTY